MSPKPNVLQVLDIAEVITHTIDAATDYFKAKESEKTERQRIMACLEAISLKLQTEREKFELFIERSFNERERLYKTIDQLIQKSMENNDADMLKLAMNCMLNVYNKNPLDGYREVAETTSFDTLSGSMRNYLD